MGLNCGTFIGEIFKDINNNINNNNNYIITEIQVNDINKNYRILNSYEEERRTYKSIMEEIHCNEEEIKQCEIRINNELIPFNYYYKFKNKGKYQIKYSFNNYLTNTNSMFYQCKSLTKIDLSNFNTKNVTDMYSMFAGCSSLRKENIITKDWRIKNQPIDSI